LSLPSKAQQIAAVAKFMDSDFTEGKSLDEAAKAVVDGYHEALVSGLKKPATPLRQDMLFKMPIDNKVRRVAWLEDGKVWIVGETDSYGWLGNESDSTWDLCEEFRPKTYKVIEEKRKLVEQIQRLESALERRALIERAKGILMERHSVTERAAFDLLRDHARSRNRTVVDVATSVTEGHALLPKARD